MPSKTAKQKRTMSAAAHSPEFAKKVGIPVKVAKEFNRADTTMAKKGSSMRLLVMLMAPCIVMMLLAVGVHIFVYCTDKELPEWLERVFFGSLFGVLACLTVLVVGMIWEFAGAY